MKSSAATFWNWFREFVTRLTDDEPSEDALDELLERIHRVDDRIYFELPANTPNKELILTAEGNVDAFPAVEALVESARHIDGWSVITLKPPRGFDFVYRNDEIVLNAAELWFLPLETESDSVTFALQLGLPDAVLARQTVDTAYTILETGIGERSCAIDIERVTIDDLPADPAANGYIELPRLAEYISWRRSKRAS